MLKYIITTGIFSVDNNFAGKGYSGAGLTLDEGRNNPAMVQEHGLGPIPPGRYRVMPSRNSKSLGPLTFDLVPLPGTDVFGRSLFRIHGNNKADNASHGCIILDHNIRAKLDEIISPPQPSNDDDYNVLEVLAS